MNLDNFYSSMAQASPASEPPTNPPVEPPANKESTPTPQKSDEDIAQALYAEGPPEKYAFVHPEGFAHDQAGYEAFTPIFRQMKLTNAQAQELVNAHARHNFGAGKAKK